VDLLAHPYLLAAGVIVTLFLLLRLIRSGGNPQKKFGGKVVIITGASSGLGEELAVQLSKYAPKLVLAARRVELLDKLKKRCEDSGATEVLAVATDVGKKEDCQRLVQAAVKKFGAIDVLFCNAGIAMSTTLFKAESPDVLEDVMRINYHGAVNTAFYALPELRKSAGHIVVTSSVLAFIITRGASAYAASKAALNSFFSTLRLEEKRNRVKVTIVCPGHVDTDLQKFMLGPDGKPVHQTETRNLGFRVPLTDAVRRMVRATAANEELVIYTFGANVLCRLRAAFPVFVDNLLARFV